MNDWKIEYWSEGINISPIEKWLNKLDKIQFRFVTKELDILILSGNELRLPHSKALGKGLFELREREFGYRIYY